MFGKWSAYSTSKSQQNLYHSQLHPGCLPSARCAKMGPLLQLRFRFSNGLSKAGDSDNCGFFSGPLSKNKACLFGRVVLCPEFGKSPLRIHFSMSSEETSCGFKMQTAALTAEDHESFAEAFLQGLNLRVELQVKLNSLNFRFLGSYEGSGLDGMLSCYLECFWVPLRKTCFAQSCSYVTYKSPRGTLKQSLAGMMWATFWNCSTLDRNQSLHLQICQMVSKKHHFADLAEERAKNWLGYGR